MHGILSNGEERQQNGVTTTTKHGTHVFEFLSFVVIVSLTLQGLQGVPKRCRQLRTLRQPPTRTSRKICQDMFRKLWSGVTPAYCYCNSLDCNAFPDPSRLTPPENYNPYSSTCRTCVVRCRRPRSSNQANLTKAPSATIQNAALSSIPRERLPTGGSLVQSFCPPSYLITAQHRDREGIRACLTSTTSRYLGRIDCFDRGIQQVDIRKASSLSQ
ncbi:hypothetical protein FPV67DRAFT_510458 [Lyophyllum atratum]|nr:hypothetical protein FPV67DRAFT_510458 [Lyophyllum atratum]